MGIFEFLIAKFSVFGFVLFAIIASFFPGIPEEVFLLTIGYIGGTTGFGIVSFYEVMLLLVFGFTIVDTITYWLSWSGNKFMKKFASFLLDRWFTKDEKFIRRNMKKIIFFSRFIIQFRIIGAFTAGTYKYSYWRYIGINTIALLIYVPMYLGIGSYFQNRINQIINGVEVVGNIIWIVVILLVLFGAIKIFMRWFKSSYRNDRSWSFFGFTKLTEEKKE